MSLEDAKSKITARIWQAIARSGVAVTAIPQDQMNTLVDSIAEGVLVAVNELFEEAGMPVAQQFALSSPASSGPTTTAEEQVLWEGRPYLSLVTAYQITTERVRLISGLLGKEREDIELIRIQDIDHSQGISERVLNIGDIHIQSSDPSLPEATLRNVTSPQEVHEILRRAMINARKKFRYSVQEEM